MNFSPSPQRQPLGAALLLTLSAVALITLMLVAFLGLVRTESRSSQAFADGVEVQQLSDLPVNLVMDQIRKATESKGIGQGATNGATRTWASQPGAIRTYGNTGSSQASGGRVPLDKIYKLYSDDLLVEGNTFNANNDLPPATWDTQAGIYTDLNEPVFVDADSDPATPDVPEYPIIDPAALTANIEGFEVDTSSGVAAAGEIPMPTKWLYVLEDGSLAVPASQNANGEVTFDPNKGTVPSATNPITSRIAYWTDDESTKVNINTASEGRFWDVPRGNNNYDAFMYADFLPMTNEYQRFPGHPAGTHLSTVLGNWLGDPKPNRNKFNWAGAVATPTALALQSKDIANTYHALSPYVEPGGSEYGTRYVTSGSGTTVQLDSDRLYATVDEYIFKATSLAAGERQMNHPSLNRTVLDQTKFFLTAHSRAPETNLFNQPRLSLWPIQENEGDRNAFDKLLAFCSQTQTGTTPLPYFLQRKTVHQGISTTGYSSSQDTTADYDQISRNQDLYRYLQTLMSRDVPGFGDSFNSKYPSDRNQIITSMIDHVRSGVNTMAVGIDTPNNSAGSSKGYFYAPPRQLPGLGALEGEAQIIPLIPSGDGAGTKGFGRAATITELSIVIYPVTTSTSDDLPFASLTPQMPNLATWNGRSGRKATMARAFVIAELFCPSVGPPTWSPYMDVTLEFDGVQANGTNLNFGNSPSEPGPTVRYHTPVGFMQSGATGAGHLTARLSPFMPFYRGANSGISTRDVESKDPTNGFAWHSAPFAIPSTGGFSFGGGTVDITLKSAATGQTFQTIEMDWPTTFVPQVFAFSADSRETSLQNRINSGVGRGSGGEGYRTWLIRPGDAVRSIGANISRAPKGDLRLYAARENVPASYFGPVGEEVGSGGGGWSSREYFASSPLTAYRLNHRIRNGNDWQYFGHLRGAMSNAPGNEAAGGNGKSTHPFARYSSTDCGGSLAAEMTSYRINGGGHFGGGKHSAYRDFATIGVENMEAALRNDGRPGDWDQGFGNNEDGPFIKKPDEANSSTSNWNWGNFHHRGGYFGRGSYQIDANARNYSPNRQITSAVQFGSLSTGVFAERPWETPVFSPTPAGRTTASTSEPTSSDHIGFSFPRDHLLLDLFWMPIVEPYAISEPFSTAGKVNMNYDILPFRYIKRRTGIHAVLAGTEVMAVPAVAGARIAANGTNLGCYKGGRDQDFKRELRYDVNLDENDGTLWAFEDRFNTKNDIFRSASEICEIYMVPKRIPGSEFGYPDGSLGGDLAGFPWGNSDPKYSDMQNWWSYFPITGDNTREAPYNHLYPRLTTKSNSFNVHYRVQTLSQGPGADKTKWNESRDAVISEQRGSVLLERYVDPNDSQIPDFAQMLTGNTFNQTVLDDYYRFRIIRRKRFAP